MLTTVTKTSTPSKAPTALTTTDNADVSKVSVTGSATAKHTATPDQPISTTGSKTATKPIDAATIAVSTTHASLAENQPSTPPSDSAKGGFRILELFTHK